jgi:hypothetical protein
LSLLDESGQSGVGVGKILHILAIRDFEEVVDADECQAEDQKTDHQNEGVIFVEGIS